MGPVNWLAVILAANLAVALGIVWHGPLFRTGRPLLEGAGGGASKSYGAVVLVMLIGATMLGHNYARIGAATLQAKPWLYPMQSGGIAAFFIIPAVWLASARYAQAGSDRAPTMGEQEMREQEIGGPSVGARPASGLRLRLIDSGFWLAAYLVMGATFWALG